MSKNWQKLAKMCVFLAKMGYFLVKIDPPLRISGSQPRLCFLQVFDWTNGGICAWGWIVS